MKNKLKNICSVLLIMACMFTLTSCKEVENAEKAVTDFMTAIQNCDYETMASIGNGMVRIKLIQQMNRANRFLIICLIKLHMK